MVLIEMKKAIGIILVLVLTIGLLGLTACSGSRDGLKIDQTAPDFKLNNLDGQSVSLNSFKGKAVFVNFWSSTSSSSVNEMPAFQELYKSWSARSDIVLLTIDIGEDKTTVKDFIQKNNYTFPVLLDTQYEVAGKYGIQYAPTSILIGKDGKVQLNTIGGFKDVAAIEKQLANFLSS
jgi:peroxiredoxin